MTTRIVHGDRVCYDEVGQHQHQRIEDRQKPFFAKCLNLAHKSTLTQKHGCVIVRNNTIISCGYNYKLKNTSHVGSMHTCFSVHAECATIKKVKNYDLTKCDLYVVRLGPSSTVASLESLEDAVPDVDVASSLPPPPPPPKRYMYKYSHPCAYCTKIIKEHGIRRVYYSINS